MNRWNLMFQRGKKAGIKDEFPFLGKLFPNTFLELGDRKLVIRLMHYHFSQKGFQQSQVSQVTQKDHPAISQELHHLPKNTDQVVRVREILDHRVDDNRIEERRRKVLKLI